MARSGKDEITLGIKSSLYLKVVFFTVQLKELPDMGLKPGQG
jgi:hypothetical protein